MRALEPAIIFSKARWNAVEKEAVYAYIYVYAGKSFQEACCPYSSANEGARHMTRRPTYTEMQRVDRLQNALRRIDKQLGYMEVLGSNATRFEVFGSPLGRASLGSRYRKVEVGGDALLKEMENLAIYYKIRPQVEYASASKQFDRDPPNWLHKEGKKFWNSVQRRETVRGLPIASGVHIRRFGPNISFVLSVKDTFASTPKQIQLDTKQHQTQQEIVCADVSGARLKLEAYKYLPTDEHKYGSKLKYEAGMDFNRSMYTYVELRKMAPSAAYNKWVADSKKYEQALLTLIAVSFVGP